MDECKQGAYNPIDSRTYVYDCTFSLLPMHARGWRGRSCSFMCWWLLHISWAEILWPNILEAPSDASNCKFRKDDATWRFLAPLTVWWLKETIAAFLYAYVVNHSIERYVKIVGDNTVSKVTNHAENTPPHQLCWPNPDSTRFIVSSFSNWT